MEKTMSYLGSKAASGAYQAIIALMPPQDTYIELFAGSGAVLKRKPPAARSIAIDMAEEAIKALPKNYPGLETITGDAFVFLDGFEWENAGRVLVYADPPYLHETRTSRQRYKFEMHELEHDVLLMKLFTLPAQVQVILSGYPSKKYDAGLPGWNTREFQAMTRGGPRTEKLWFNFEPSLVQWASYAGKNFADRQRIKRKAARWADNYKALPAGERLAILAAILEASAGIDASGYVGQHSHF